jgi:transcriptional regulator with XRE-family HTH domain
MAAGGDPAALGQLLRSRRERLVPADVGLPAGLSAGRRRTAGLRREEVAMLASLSVTYYTFLEQGRPVRPSEQVLDALAAALRMSAAERRYLYVLAYGPDDASGSAPGPRTGSAAPPELIDPAVAGLVQRLEPFPTLVKGRRWDVLAANPAARELFGDWSAGTMAPPGERNLVRWMFTTDQAREVYLEWEPEARAMLGRFRLSAARHPDDPDISSLIAGLQRDSEHVRDWWPRHDVTAIGGSGSKKLRHPRLGPVEYSHAVLQVADQPDQTLVTYSPVIGALVTGS